MDSVVSAPVEPELQLLTTWGQPGDADRRRTALIATILFHIAATTTLFLLPESFFQNKTLPPEPAHHITPIFAPLTKLTQKTPNNGKLSKEFTAEERGTGGHLNTPGPPPSPRPAPQQAHASAPPPPPPPKRQPVRQAVIPQMPPKPVQNAQPLPEPPKVDAPVNTPKVDIPQNGVIPPPPKIQPQEQPKLALENLGQSRPTVVPPEQRQIPLPDTSVRGAIEHPTQGGPTRPAAPPAGSENNQGLQLPQLLTDSQGVDFTSYLRIILQTVRRNWQAVIPESVRLGARGKVSVVLAIERDGRLGKVVIYESSGLNPLDQAAVSGISMSQPFPQLPPEFKGGEIRVQFNFAYNAPK